jgi:hypothetical protein
MNRHNIVIIITIKEGCKDPESVILSHNLSSVSIQRSKINRTPTDLTESVYKLLEFYPEHLRGLVAFLVEGHHEHQGVGLSTWLK